MKNVSSRKIPVRPVMIDIPPWMIMIVAANTIQPTHPVIRDAPT